MSTKKNVVLKRRGVVLSPDGTAVVAVGFGRKRYDVKLYSDGRIHVTDKSRDPLGYSIGFRQASDKPFGGTPRAYDALVTALLPEERVSKQASSVAAVQAALSDVRVKLCRAMKLVGKVPRRELPVFDWHRELEIVLEGLDIASEHISRGLEAAEHFAKAQVGHRE